jgi:hypothetical protein
MSRTVSCPLSGRMKIQLEMELGLWVGDIDRKTADGRLPHGKMVAGICLPSVRERPLTTW